VGAAHLAARAVGAGVARPELHYEPVVSPTHHKEIYDVKFEVYLHHLRRNNHPTPENKH